MKILKSFAVCVLLNLCFLKLSAQNIPINEPNYNKPKMFSDLPEKFNLQINSLVALLDLPEGKTVTAPLVGAAAIHGVIVSKSDVLDENFKSVVIKLTNRQGATFTFTRTTKEDGTYAYLGRIISHKHSDAYEVVLEEDKYVFKKTHLYELFNE